MEETKIQKGPESPADLQWLQGAKNPRKETDTILIDQGTLLSDTNDPKPHFAETFFADDICNEQNIIVGPPQGDTATKLLKDHTVAKLTPTVAKLSPTVSNSSPTVANLSSTVAKVSPTVGSRPPIVRLPLSKKKRKKVRKKLQSGIQQGHIDENYGVLKTMSGHRLSITLQPRKKWYKEKLRAKTSILDKLFSNSLEVAILCGGNKEGSLTLEQSKIIINKLTENIYNVPKEKIVPKFEKFEFEDGVLRITCFNDESVKWLKQEDFLNLWKAGTAMALNKNDFQKSNPYRTFIPGSLKSSTTILKLLSIQNPGLYAHTFNITKRAEFFEGASLEFSLDEESVKRLENLGMRPYCGICRITFIEFKKFTRQAINTTAPPQPLNKNISIPPKTKSSRRKKKSYITNNTPQSYPVIKISPTKMSNPPRKSKLGVDSSRSYSMSKPYIINKKNENKMSHVQSPGKSKITVHKHLGSPLYTLPKYDRSMSFSQYFESLKSPQTAQSSLVSNMPEIPDRYNNQGQFPEAYQSYNQQQFSGITSTQNLYYERPRELEQFSLYTDNDNTPSEPFRPQNPYGDDVNFTQQSRTCYPDFAAHPSSSSRFNDTMRFSSTRIRESSRHPNTSQYSNSSMYNDSQKRVYDSDISSYRQISKRLRIDQYEMPAELSNRDHNSRRTEAEKMLESTRRRYSSRERDATLTEAETYVEATRNRDPRSRLAVRRQNSKQIEDERYLEAIRKHDSSLTEAERYLEASRNHDTRSEAERYLEAKRNYDMGPTEAEWYLEGSRKHDTRSTEAERYFEAAQKHDSRSIDAERQRYDEPWQRESELYVESYRRNDLKQNNSYFSRFNK